MQAVPKALNTDIIKILHASSDRHNKPDSLYGYGIPDMVIALSKLQEYVNVADEEAVVSPNPTTGNIEIDFRQPPGFITIEIISMTGKLIWHKDFPDYTERILQITELQGKVQGTYFVRVTTINGVKVYKIIKVRD
jgi:hypothetical protein